MHWIARVVADHGQSLLRDLAPVVQKHSVHVLIVAVGVAEIVNAAVGLVAAVLR